MREHSGLPSIIQMHSPNTPLQSLMPSQTVDGKPVIQAAVLAGNFEWNFIKMFSIWIIWIEY